FRQLRRRIPGRTAVTGLKNSANTPSSRFFAGALLGRHYTLRSRHQARQAPPGRGLQALAACSG
ncbi:MAG: hypothetical protein WD005_00515, partial [Haliea sp.]